MNRTGIEELFSNRILTGLLSVFTLHPDEEFHQRRLAELVGGARRPVQLNLQRLEKLNLIRKREDGNRVAYRCNRESPIFEELRSIILKTAGLGDVIRRGLEPYAGAITAAFIYGSVAEGEDDAHSDIDLMIIGDIGSRKASIALSEAKSFLRREISLSVHSRDGFRTKHLEGNHYIRRVVASPKIFIIGGEDELARLLK